MSTGSRLLHDLSVRTRQRRTRPMCAVAANTPMCAVAANIRNTNANAHTREGLDALLTAAADVVD